MTKEEYYEKRLKDREIVSDPHNTKCPCASVSCEWHGKCKECVALHRYNGHNPPICMQPMIFDRLKHLVWLSDDKPVNKDNTPIEFRKYVEEMDAENLK